MIHASPRSIPSMDDLLRAPWAAAFFAALGRDEVKAAIVSVLDGLRREMTGAAVLDAPLDDLVMRRCCALLQREAASTLKRAVNATGVVVHTNLGRAPLAPAALAAVAAVSDAYSTLEYSPEAGGRQSRNDHVEWLVCRLTGAEAALAVNNNAAAVLLALSTLAAGREVVVSCGELVEIGGSFRIPEILAFSGAKMTVAGCTNATRLDDWQNAVTENTAALLKVHPSNYRIEGFCASTSRRELAALAAERRLALIEDLGSGLLSPLALPFAEREHSVRDCLAAGVNIVTFSGDKLLGGPQIGVIAGDKRLVDQMRRHQLLRALRVDKMTLAAFEATLRLYLTGKRAEIPVVRLIELDAPVLRQKARRLQRLLRDALGSAGFQFTLVETLDAAGGGAFPTDTLAGFGVAVRAPAASAESLAAALRRAAVPVIAAVKDDRVILHVRTLLDGDEKRIAAALAPACGGEGEGA